MKRFAIILVALLMLAFSLPMQVQAEENHLVNGRSKEELSLFINEYINKHKDTTAGVSLAVFRSDETIVETYYGSIDKERNLPVNEDSVMEWGSATKLLTWVSVMQLWEKGLIDLDRNISEYFPDDFKLKLKYPITMKHLMTHTAGFQEVIVGIMVADEASILGLKETLLKLQPKQIYQPGDITAYSNYGVALAAYVVECVTNIPFYEYVHQNIFEPLGMEHTALNADLSDAPWVKKQWEKLQRYSTTATPLPYPSLYIPLYPAGMAVSTLKDMIRFSQALLPGEASKLLFQNPDTLTELYQPTSLYANETERNCHGLWVENYKSKVIGHGGNTAGCSANILIQPETGIGVVVQTNQSTELVYNMKLMPYFFGDNFPVTEEFQPVDISGVFLQARTVKRNIFKLYSLLTTLPVIKAKDGFSVPLMASTLKQINPHDFMLSGGGFTYPLSYLKRNGQGILQDSVTDYVELNPNEYIPMLLSTLLFVISLIISLFQLLIDLIRKLRRKNKKPLAVIRNLCNGALWLCFGNILLQMILSISYVSTLSTLYFHASVSFLCMMIACLYLVKMIILLVKDKKGAMQGITKAARYGYILTGISGFCLLFFILYWQLLFI